MKKILESNIIEYVCIVFIVIAICFPLINFAINFIKDAKNDSDREEAKLWNNGICPKCKTEWRFKTTSTKGIFLYCDTDYIYECENGHTIELHKLHE